MTDSINLRVSQIIQQVTGEQITHLLGAGAGRYKQYLESVPEQIDGYAFSWSVDEFLGPQGVGCIFNFFARKDGQAWCMIDGHGPGYSGDVDQPWLEIADKPEGI